MTDPRVIVALDYDNPVQAMGLVERLNPSECRLKVGKELFTLAGPELVKEIQGKGFDLFLDLKFHDIPATTANAVAAVASLGVWMVNIHASGGRSMMAACRDRLDQLSLEKPPLLIAVTVLTSMAQTDITDLGISRSIDQQVENLSLMAHQCGMDGVVCSARESEKLRQQFGPGFKLVTPGIRPQGTAMDDQSRVMTPADAVAAGSSYLVVGRPITRAADPLEALRQINEQLAFE